ncbi:hypothetical protein [Magnetovibrio sp.]|uniref:hypothetical protein n=1 Tax=Magnetovibrio sp. TaxID=2024836 RepID=UPI002F941339
MRNFVMMCLLATAVLISGQAFAKGDSSYVVLMSSVTDYKTGDEIQGDQDLTVPDKKQLVLINAFGQTLKFKGFFQGKPQDQANAAAGGQAGRSMKALASLIRSADEDTSSVGAIRAASLKSATQAMAFNLSETGNYCFADKAGITLERYRTETGAKITLINLDTGKEQVIDAPAAGQSVPWPTALDVSEGARFLVIQEGKDSKTLLTLRQLTPPLDSDFNVLVSLGELECMEQARMLLSVIRRENR